MIRFIAAAAIGAAILISPAVHAQDSAPAKVAETAKGKALVDDKGMTLYVFDKDAPGKSSCTGPCLRNWPAFIAAADATPSGDWTIVIRDDGTRQWAYKNKPLYTWTKDAKPGDANGDGVGDAWRIAAP